MKPKLPKVLYSSLLLTCKFVIFLTCHDSTLSVNATFVKRGLSFFFSKIFFRVSIVQLDYLPGGGGI